MKSGMKNRVGAAFLTGTVIAVLWPFLSSLWALHVELGFIFPALYRFTGVNGPWMVSVGNILFALATAFVFAACVVILFGNIRGSILGVVLAGFLTGQLLIGWWAETSIPYLATYLPLWLFVLLFALAALLMSSRMAGTWPNKGLKSDAAKPRTVGGPLGAMIASDGRRIIAGFVGAAVTFIVWFLVKHLSIDFESPTYAGLIPGAIGGTAGGAASLVVNGSRLWPIAVLVCTAISVSLSLFPVYSGRQSLAFYYWFAGTVALAQLTSAYFCASSVRKKT